MTAATTPAATMMRTAGVAWPEVGAGLGEDVAPPSDVGAGLGTGVAAALPGAGAAKATTSSAAAASSRPPATLGVGK